jgi:putative ABC transport system permease protein
MTRLVTFELAREQALAWLAVIFAAFALGLAAVGLYGVMAFHITARRGEIGVRMTLGADRRHVVAMVLCQSSWLVIAGVALGAPLALGARRLLDAQLYGVPAWDPTPPLAAAAASAIVGTLASLLPAWRAARVDPLVAIRSE